MPIEAARRASAGNLVKNAGLVAGPRLALVWSEIKGADRDPAVSDEPTFSEEQTSYLGGFLRGVDAARTRIGLSPVAEKLGGVVGAAAPAAAPSVPGRPELVHLRAQDRFLAEGRKLSPEEEAKRAGNPLDVWDAMQEHAREGRFPKGLDVYRWKFHGLFQVAPAEDAFMCRLRLPGGLVSSHQLRGIAAIAERFGAGHADVTTRANLQLRGIGAQDGVEVLASLHELGIVPRGAGADNVRNITGSPTAGVDPQELIDTRPLTRALHHHVLHHRELYGLPRKFNVAFDGGGSVGVLEETNDVGFAAVRVGEGQTVPAGVHFRLRLGGVTGHGDFARDAGVVVAPAQCVAVADAIIRVFLDHGDRTDRKKARLKFVLDRLGHDRFLAEVEKLLPAPLPRLPLERCEPRAPWAKHGHVGAHPQRQPGLFYLGLVLPVGRLDAAQLRGLAALAERLGSGTLRLTVWQNVIVPDLPEDRLAEAQAEVEALGLGWRAGSLRGALVACTGTRGCKYSATDTKAHAHALADHLDARLELDEPINIHLTGCPHSCAQHRIADIGLLGVQIEVAGGGLAQGYHVHVGGGAGSHEALGREIVRDVAETELAPLLERLLRGWLDLRREAESFQDFTKRFPVEALRALCASPASPERAA
ncbi:MAG: NirA family protein [Anaeromyxobacteraceae bacterium]